MANEETGVVKSLGSSSQSSLTLCNNGKHHAVWAVLGPVAAVEAGFDVAQLHPSLVLVRLGSVLTCAFKGHPLAFLPNESERV